jgi:hypothetical protein
MNILCILYIILIIILIYLINFNKYENFENHNKDLSNILNNYKINIIKNQDVDVICSGPSSKNIKLKSNIIFCVNDSILNKVLSEINNKKKIIWLLCRINFFTINNFKEKYLDKINFNIDYLIIRTKIVNLKKYSHIIKLIKQKCPNIIILENNFDNKTIKKLEVQQKKLKRSYLPIISCGIQALNICLKNGVKNVYISGQETGNNNYVYNTELNTKPTVKTPAHILEDKQYLKNLSVYNLNKIKANKNSGLFNFINNIKKK